MSAQIPVLHIRHPDGMCTCGGATCHPSWATFSECGGYRYALGRRWADGPALAVIGHNPSTADESVDDPTIRRCIGFAKRDGFGALLMLNLCAWRDTNPKGLDLLVDPIGPENDSAILDGIRTAGRVLAAWGALAGQSKSQAVRERAFNVLRLLAPIVPVYALKVGKDGSPGHPLYLRGDLPMVIYREGRS
ncbi:DUF1643 domain-containing protein [Hyalangium sp.]|uniref:DUF1643 domain-containing protein n=1 Tax=Hyalangium sp. TaxID=2028555 RepID=UPI002D52003E|nr:DUF1643 domain-containing protein [Hyalangium sp.]HYH96028.1 DUF1643 domain-containing protein [Hyalangium sp.]